MAASSAAIAVTCTSKAVSLPEITCVVERTSALTWIVIATAAWDCGCDFLA